MCCFLADEGCFSYQFQNGSKITKLRARFLPLSQEVVYEIRYEGSGGFYGKKKSVNES